jgi:hypothetical protein
VVIILIFIIIAIIDIEIINSCEEFDKWSNIRELNKRVRFENDKKSEQPTADDFKTWI